VLRGHVVDFFELPRWPVFNVADMAIVGSAAFIVLLSLMGRQLDGTRSGGQGARV
jgi:signal peptidase II